MTTAEQPSVFWLKVQEIGGPEHAAFVLQQKLGKPIDKLKVQRFGRKRMPPKSWLEALEIGPAPEPQDSPPPGAEPETGRAQEKPPRPPDERSVLPPPAAIQQQARERIEALHVFAGSSIATAVDPDGFQNGTGVGGGVAAIWTDKAKDIAAAWVAWAEEGNKFAQSFVRLMGTGGAGGNLVLGYAALIGGTAYIMGQLPDNDATRLVYGRYSRYRPVTPEPRDDDGGTAAGNDTAGNGSAPAGTPLAVVVPPGASV